MRLSELLRDTTSVTRRNARSRLPRPPQVAGSVRAVACSSDHSSNLARRVDVRSRNPSCFSSWSSTLIPTGTAPSFDEQAPPNKPLKQTDDRRCRALSGSPPPSSTCACWACGRRACPGGLFRIARPGSSGSRRGCYHRHHPRPCRDDCHRRVERAPRKRRTSAPHRAWHLLGRLRTLRCGVMKPFAAGSLRARRSFRRSRIARPSGVVAPAG